MNFLRKVVKKCLQKPKKDIINLMNLILKQFLIIGAVFLIILWFQQQDDKRNKRERKSFYDKYKLTKVDEFHKALKNTIYGQVGSYVQKIFSNDKLFLIAIVIPFITSF